MKKIWYAFMLLAIGLVSCNKTDDLWDEVNDLKDRVTSLETQIKDLNWNIEAIRELAKEGATITGIEEKDGAYKITMSDGKVLNLIQQTENSNLLPVVGIDSDGYWVVSYNGKPATRIKDTNGKDIMAKGENGVTPKFSVDAEGYWLIQYGTDAASRVKDENGNDVKATGGSTGGASDNFFEKVEKRANELYIKLATGEEMIIPIVSNFSCVIDATGVQVFTAGEVKSFNVAMKGVENTMITTPNGWKAELSKDEAKADDATAYILKVTAPSTSATPSTRASADNSKDIAILATSGAYACIAKIQVELKAETPVINDLYNLYMEGKDIEVGDIKINKSTYGEEPILLKAEDMTAEIDIRSYINQQTDKNVVLFLEKGSFDYITSASIVNISSKNIVIIGRYVDQIPTIKFGLHWRLQAGSLFLKNLHLNLSSINGASNAGYAFANAGATTDFTNFYLEDCKISSVKKPFYYASVPTIGINNIYMQNSSIQVTEDAALLFNLYNSTNLEPYKNFTLKNNLIYSATAVKGQLLAWTNTSIPPGEASKRQSTNVSICNNTLVNYVGVNYHTKLFDAKSIIIKKNVFYADDSYASNSTLCSLYKTGANPTFDVVDNIAFGLKDTNSWISFPAASTASPKNESQLTRLDTTPFKEMNFTTGSFVLDSNYAGYGATIK